MVLTEPERSAVVVIDAHLHELTMNAVAALSRRLDEHLATTAPVPTQAVPRLVRNGSGWPTVPTDRWDEGTRRSNPVSVFGAKADDYHPLAWGDLPQMADFTDYVFGQGSIVSRLTVPDDAFTVVNRIQGALDSMTRIWATDLPLSILARTLAGSNESLDDLYEQRERAWLAPALPVEYFVPLVLTSFDIIEWAELSPGVRVEPMSEAYQLECGRHPAAHPGVSHSIVQAATHALIVDTPDLSNEGPAGRFRSDRPFDPHQPDALARLDRACEALRIVGQGHVGYATIFLRPLGWADHWSFDLPPLIPLQTLRGYAHRHQTSRSWPKLGEHAFSAESVERAGRVFDALAAAPSAVKLATRRLTLAANRDDEDDKTVDACIGFEALLGDTQTELTHRLCQRTAAVLATASQPRDPQEVYRLMKGIYSHRSKIVHGGVPDRHRTIELVDGTRKSTADVAVELLRDVLLDKHERLGGWSPEELDAMILRGLRPSTSDVVISDRTVADRP